jgi:DNA-binding response OmpR family regulator
MAKPVAPGATSRSRVLVVEDEFLIAAMVQDMLSDLGYDCLGPLITLEAGVAAATSERFEAAIINLVIQGRHSYEIVEILAARGIPFCFASGIDKRDVAERWRDRPFLTKPYTLANVRDFLLGISPVASTPGAVEVDKTPPATPL